MEYVDDKGLSTYQRKLKWSLYCEVDSENDCDIEAVLKSLLNDLGE